MKKNYFEWLVRSIIGSAMVVTTMIMMLSGKGASDELEGTWKLDINKTYRSMQDSFKSEFVKSNKSKLVSSIIQNSEMNEEWSSSNALKENIAKANIATIMNIKAESGSLGVRNRDGNQRIFQYQKFTNQLTIGENKFKIIHLDNEKLVIRAKDQIRGLNFPLFFSKKF